MSSVDGREEAVNALQNTVLAKYLLDSELDISSSTRLSEISSSCCSHYLDDSESLVNNIVRMVGGAEPQAMQPDLKCVWKSPSCTDKKKNEPIYTKNVQPQRYLTKDGRYLMEVFLSKVDNGANYSSEDSDLSNTGSEAEERFVPPPPPAKRGPSLSTLCRSFDCPVELLSEKENVKKSHDKLTSTVSIIDGILHTLKINGKITDDGRLEEITVNGKRARL